MARIMRSCIHPLKEAKRPRVLGLTASYVHGAMKNPEKRKRQLEMDMQAQIFSPVIPPHASSAKHFERVFWTDLADRFQPYEESIRCGIGDQLARFPIKEKMRKTLVENSWKVLTGNGCFAGYMLPGKRSQSLI